MALRKKRIKESPRISRVEPAKSSDVLRKRLERLLRLTGRNSASTELNTRILPFLYSLGSVALIGGAVRDVARAGSKGFNSDFDFIVFESDRDHFRKSLEERGAIPNRFGGFRLIHFQCHVDVWHIDDTWAKTAGLVNVSSLRDLLQCTFFDWDAAIFDVVERQLILPDDYLDLLQSNILDIRLEENPNVIGSVVRAIRRAALWGVFFGPRLSEYVKTNLRLLSWGDLVNLDERAFSQPVLRFLDLREMLDQLEKPIDVRQKAVTSPVPDWMPQMQLPWRDDGNDIELPSV